MMNIINWPLRHTMIVPDKYEIYYKDNNLSEVALHHHDFFELYYFKSGNISFIIEGRSYELKSGDILLISPNELHQMKNFDQTIYERYVLWISKNWLKTMSSQITDLSQVFTIQSKNRTNKCPASPNESKVILEIIKKISKLNKSTKFGDDTRSNIHLIELLLLLNEIYIKSDEVQAMSNETIEKAITYINNNFSKDLQVSTIADHLFISPSRLSHLFKVKTGTSVYQYVIKRRLMEAKSLLLSDMPAIKVAEKCGFCSYLGFFKLFKKEYGMTPTEYYKLFNKIE